jgi:hypothetical protein
MMEILNYLEFIAYFAIILIRQKGKEVKTL